MNNSMRSLKETREAILKGWPSHPAAPTSLAIVDRIAAAPTGTLLHLTFRNLAQFANKEVVDEDLLMAVSILTSAPVNVFSVHFSFIDHDDHETELDPTDVESYQRSGILIDPSTGNPVDDPKAHLLPFFVPIQAIEKDTETA